MFFDNSTSPRRSEPGAISNARRRLAQVGVHVGGCAEPTQDLGSGNGREPPHPSWQQLIIFLTLPSNSFKKVPRVLLSYTIHMTTCGQEMSRYFGRSKTLSLECQTFVFPQFPLGEQRPLGEDEYARGRTKSPLKRQKAHFFDVATPLPDSIWRSGRRPKAGETRRGTLFSDAHSQGCFMPCIFSQ